MTPEQKALAIEYLANTADVSTSTQLLRAAMKALPPTPPAPVEEREPFVYYGDDAVTYARSLLVSLQGSSDGAAFSDALSGFAAAIRHDERSCLPREVIAVDATHPRQSDERAAVTHAVYASDGCVVVAEVLRDAVIEECARVCDVQANAIDSALGLGLNSETVRTMYAAAGAKARTCASLIRALATPAKPVVSAGCEKCGEPRDLEGSTKRLCALCVEASDPSAPSMQGGGHVETGPNGEDRHYAGQWWYMDAAGKVTYSHDRESLIAWRDGNRARFGPGQDCYDLEDGDTLDFAFCVPPPDPTAKIVARLRALVVRERANIGVRLEPGWTDEAVRINGLMLGHGADVAEDIADEIEREAKGRA